MSVKSDRVRERIRELRWVCVPFWDNELIDPDFDMFNTLAHAPATAASG